MPSISRTIPDHYGDSLNVSTRQVDGGAVLLPHFQDGVPTDLCFNLQATKDLRDALTAIIDAQEAPIV